MSSQESNFIFSIPPLSNDRIAIVPWKVPEHSQLFVDNTKSRPGIFKYIIWPPDGFPTLESFQEWYDKYVVPDPQRIVFAVYNKSTGQGKGGEFAGMVGCLNASAENAVLEIGCVITIPKFQRTHVTTNAVGLLVQYMLDRPPSGLGLRRVQWQAPSLNSASITSAKRLGFELECVIRWHSVIPVENEGNGKDTSQLPEVCGKKLGKGRDSVMLAICWDEWEEKRKKLAEMMARI